VYRAKGLLSSDTKVGKVTLPIHPLEFDKVYDIWNAWFVPDEFGI